MSPLTASPRPLLMLSVRFPIIGSSELASGLRGLSGLFGLSGLDGEKGLSRSRGSEEVVVVAAGVAEFVEDARSKRIISSPTRVALSCSIRMHQYGV